MSARPFVLRAIAATPLVAALLAAAPVQAQYKITGADGKVTYTDREPSTAEGRVTALGARTAAQGGESDTLLPFELRQIAAKYPVTLYTATGPCDPCASARQLLKQRGIPYAERQVVTADDSDALEKISGAREAPTLSIGAQTLRGLAPEVWSSYLDAAGYPRESHLPAAYQYKAATPIVERREAALPRPAAAANPAPSIAPAAAVPPAPDGIRF